MPLSLQSLRPAYLMRTDRSMGIHRLLGLLFPGRCLFCQDDLGEAGSGLDHARQILLCRACVGQLAPPIEVQCRRCGAAIEIPSNSSDTRCSLCRDERWHFQEVVSLGSYHHLHDAILQMKHSSQQSLAFALGELLFSRWEVPLQSRKSDLIVPVPPHRRFSAKEERGSAATLAALLGRRMKLPVRAGMLFFRKNLRRQSSLLPTERRRNVRGTLQLAKGYDIKGARALVVDDVLTTGSTAHEAARVLLEAGAERVDVAVYARGGTAS